MIRDLNIKKVMKNAFRITKTKYKTALRVRVPGGLIDPECLMLVSEISSKYGDGKIHITTRQGFEILGIDMEDMPAVNEMAQPLIDKLNINQDEKGKGYPAAGTRNVSACIGNKVCPKAQYNTTEFARRVEKAIFPNDLHFKVALTGCPNDCIKARMHDFGIIGTCLIIRDENKCIGCGECVINCPMSAWTRSPKKYYKLMIMGRTGKKNPRLAEDWLRWVDEDSIVKIIENTYQYVKEYISKDAPNGKEHIGYIVDRTGFQEFRKWALKDVNLPKETVERQNIYWSGPKYDY